MKIPQELNLLLLVALIILAAAIPNQVVVPNDFYRLVQDKTNVLLLMALCVLVSYCNFPLGVMMSLFIFMVMVHNPMVEGFENENEITDPCDPGYIGNEVCNENANSTNMDPCDDSYTGTDLCCDEGSQKYAGDDVCKTNNNVGNPNNINNVPVDCDANPDDPACQSNPDMTNDTGPKILDHAILGNKIEELRSDYNSTDYQNDTEKATKICGTLQQVQDTVQCGTESFTGGVIGTLSNKINNVVDAGINSLNSENFNNTNSDEYNNLTDLDGNNANNVVTEGFMGAMSNEPQMANNNSEDFMKMQLNEQTKVALKNGHDYDVIGCRYDLQGKLNNDFVQGPPVSKCSIYDMASTQNVGCEFYPINP